MVSSINRFVRNSTLDKFECERDSSKDLYSTRYVNKVVVSNDKEVTYKVEYDGYVTQEATNIYTEDTKLDVVLDFPRYKFTINPTPSDAAVTLTAQNATQQGNSIYVYEGVTVSYTVAKDKYVTQTSSFTMGAAEKTVNVSLAKQTRTVTINPTPSTATVTLTADGYTQSGNSITVPIDTVVNYSVSADKYVTKTGSATADSNKTVAVELVKLITITVNPVPSDATVTLTAPDMPEYIQSGNSITIPSTTYAQFKVEREGYQTKNGGWPSNQFSEDRTETIELVPLDYTLSIAPTPSDATVTLTASGYTQSGNSITVPYTTNVSYQVAKTHYGTKTGTKSVIKDESISVSLTKNKYTITVNPTPSDAIVSLTSTGFAQSGNSITVDALSTVNYTVSKTGYYTKNGTITADATKTENVGLDEVLYKLTINPTPSTATVKLTAAGYTQSGNSISAPKGTSVAYTVSASGYQTKTGTTTIGSADSSLNVQLTALYTLTVSPTYSGASVTFNTSGTVSGNKITVPAGTTVSYTLTATDHVTRTLSETVNSNKTVTPQMKLTMKSPVIDHGTGTMYNVTNWVSRGQAIKSGTYTYTRGSSTCTWQVTTNARGEITGYSTSGNVTSRYSGTNVTMAPTGGWTELEVWE